MLLTERPFFVVAAQEEPRIAQYYLKFESASDPRPASVRQQGDEEQADKEAVRYYQ
jgi:hypothetical protein